ncbi:hypothetical protein B566_EDAN002217 [Ephemera danica]|nr:hypothetical protein B566_EDAN002217 [Ephemera danica]
MQNVYGIGKIRPEGPQQQKYYLKLIIPHSRVEEGGGTLRVENIGGPVQAAKEAVSVTYETPLLLRDRHAGRWCTAEEALGCGSFISAGESEHRGTRNFASLLLTRYKKAGVVARWASIETGTWRWFLYGVVYYERVAIATAHYWSRVRRVGAAATVSLTSVCTSRLIALQQSSPQQHKRTSFIMTDSKSSSLKSAMPLFISIQR